MKEFNTLLNYSEKKAMKFLMTSRQFSNLNLPEYFNFEKVLKKAQRSIGKRPYEECLSEVHPSEQDDVNHIILINKDGRYGTRPITVCNPYMYYFLCREMCMDGHWDILLRNFEECATPNIEVCSLPIIPKCKEPFPNSTTILFWWNKMEQQAIALSLQYDQMFVTDITNCYGSITHQSIEWALLRKNTTKETSDENNIRMGRNIVRLLSDMQHGTSIGIPQGSTLFDLIGDLVMAYADLQLHEALVERGITSGYKILRYRDDYKVFCNDAKQLNDIACTLQGVFEGLNFRMNSAKTMVSHSVITDSIKPDKLDYIYNTPIINKCRIDIPDGEKTTLRVSFTNYVFDSLQKHLLYILMFGREHPNCGQLKNQLNEFDKRVMTRRKEYDKRCSAKKKEGNDAADIPDITNMVPTEANVIASIGAELLRDTQDTTKDDRKIENHGIGSDAIVLCAIAAQIAVENVSAAPQALMVIARIARCLDKDDERKRICRMVAEKIRKINNSNYLQIWAQQLTIEDDQENDPVPYDEPLCSIAIGQKIKLWNNDWLKKSLTKGFEDGNIIVPDKATDNASELFPNITLEDLTDDFIDIDFAELEREIKEGKGKVLFPCQF